MTSVLRRIFPAFRSTRFNDLLLHATSIVTFEKQNVVLNDMEARGHRLSFSHWSGPAVAMRCPLFFRRGIEGTHAGPADYALCPGPDSENILHIVRN